ncbi:MAG: MoaD/ThiS family protein [Firmicutes bacterium]|jgi:molybdopterin converting factor small subunit|nr:MoaD/ThiS family protein [Bacillota bacterium]
MNPSTMTVTTLFFSFAADRMNGRHKTFDLPEGTTLGDMVRQYLEPALGPDSRNWLYSVNEEWASWETRLKNGDEIAVIPPVSGG